jgi:hypothetical protein
LLWSKKWQVLKSWPIRAIKFASQRKINFSVSSSLELMHLAAPLKDHQMPLLALLLIVLQRRKGFSISYLKGYLHASMWGCHNV